MSTPIEVFKNHIQIILENGYEIVAEITKPIGQIEICFDDAFLGLFENIELIKKLKIPIQLFAPLLIRICPEFFFKRRK